MRLANSLMLRYYMRLSEKDPSYAEKVAREKLGINKKAERKLYDMQDRRDLDV